LGETDRQGVPSVKRKKFGTFRRKTAAGGKEKDYSFRGTVEGGEGEKSGKNGWFSALVAH